MTTRRTLRPLRLPDSSERRGCRAEGLRRARRVFLLALAAVLAPPGVAHAQDAPAPATISLRVEGASGGDVGVGGRARLVGIMRPFVAGQDVVVVVKRGRTTVSRVVRRVERVAGRNAGRFGARTPRLIRPGRHRFVAFHRRTAEQRGARAESDRFSVSYPNLDPGDRGHAVAVFNDLLARQRYYTARSRFYGSATQRAVMAFRKVNGMRRTYDANQRIFRRLAARRGGLQLARPRAGRHVEVDLSRQVMVLAARGKPQHIFHVSTGAPATPSDRGKFRFYRRQAGYNSLGMYYSVYYNRGEAIHGYRSVPGYPASHGCVRNPIPNSRFIYDWVRLRMRIFVHR
ncbi:MAG: L,D-transpeptidase family protein [Gaiellaceae bacterium]